MAGPGFHLLATNAAACFMLAPCAALAASSLPDLVEAQQRDAALHAIAAGSDVNERAVDGTTALHWAAHQGDLELVEALLRERCGPERAQRLRRHGLGRGRGRG